MADIAPLEQLRTALAGRYVVERELGHGGMATVYLARDLKHSRAVAIKVLRPELADLLGRERFLREIKIAAELQHPNILPLHDSDATNGLVFYVMPYVAGESLRDRLNREKQLPLQEVFQIAQEVANALGYAHTHGVVHRDIKPGNILLSDGHALVADFGIARAIVSAGGEELTERGIAVGTPAYMSPEQASGCDAVDGRSDLYALGCVIYEMLAGEPPFTGGTVQAVIARHMQERPPSLRVVRPTVSLDVQRVIERALAKVPADRFSSSSELATALHSASARGSPALGEWLAGRRRLAVLGAAIVLAAGALGWVEMARHHPSEAVVAPAQLDPNRIAVLYFDDLSPDRRLEHIASGLTTDLIAALADVKGLTVISPEGVKPFRGLNLLLDSVVRTLAVGTIVSGSVARSGDRLRVSVRMVDPASSVQLLSQSVERPVGDLFALEDQITEEVSAGLRERLGSEVKMHERRAGTRSVAAWELVQRADRIREEGRALNPGVGNWPSELRTLQRADSLLALAESLDRTWGVPIVARGWLALSAGLDDPSPQETPNAEVPVVHWTRVGVRHAERALVLHVGDPDALELRGVARFRLWILDPAGQPDTLLEDAAKDLREATTSKPGLAHAWHTLADLEMSRGRYSEAHRAAQNALEADAYLTEAPSVYALLFLSALPLGGIDEARSWCNRGLARFPGDPRLVQCRLILLGWSGRGKADVNEAWAQLAELERADSTGVLADAWAYRRMMVAVTLARTGLRDSAHAVIQQIHSDTSGRGPPRGITVLAEAYARLLLGERDDALALIEACVRADPSARSLAAATPWFKELHPDPRFRTAIAVREQSQR